MSQVAAKKRLSLKNERVKVTAHFREQGAVLAGTQQGFCDDFDIELSLDGDLPLAVITDLIHLAHQMCFTESALTDSIHITATHFYNGRTVAT